MSDDVFSAALAKITALKQELVELERFVEQYKELELRLVGAKGGSETSSSTTKRVSDHLFPTDPSTGNNAEPARAVLFGNRLRVGELVKVRQDTKATVLARAALREIDEVGHPLPLSELAQRLEDRGLKIGGENPSGNLSAHLNNSGLLVSLKGFGWWPKRRPFANAGYPGTKLERDEAAAPHFESGAAASVDDPNSANVRGGGT